MARPIKGTTFWDRVYSHVERVGECLLFTGCKDDCGYGRINRDGKLVRLHREVWERDNGTIPTGMVVMHSCDQPSCIEPTHLSLGTQAANIADMDRKGRRRTLIGSERSTAILSEEDIPVIRARLAAGQTCETLGGEYGVTPEMIRHIKKGRAWRHVA